MAKKDIDFNKIIKSLKKYLFFVFEILKNKVELVLMLVFFLSVVFWGFIFYDYAYKAVSEDPDIFVVTLKVKEGKLKEIISEIKAREEFLKSVYNQKEIKNPFFDNTQKILLEKEEKNESEQ